MSERDIVSNPSDQDHAATERPAWFCVRSQPKHEHIAAANLRQLEDLEVFSPRIRFRKSTQRGPVWFTEALFPGYLFARFGWRQSLRAVHHTLGVRGVVHFGDRWPTIPDDIIHDLRQTIGLEELHTLPAEPDMGDEVEISGGSFHGLRGVVVRLMPGRARVGILLEFLGRQATVEVATDSIIRRPAGEERLLR